MALGADAVENKSIIIIKLLIIFVFKLLDDHSSNSDDADFLVLSNQFYRSNYERAFLRPRSAVPKLQDSLHHRMIADDSGNFVTIFSHFLNY